MNENNDPKLCSNVLPQYEITYTEAPIDYRLDKRARDLRSEFGANEYTLGYFHSNLNIEKQSVFTTFKNENKSCTDLTLLQLNLSFNPTIFITKEAQSFRCTFDRTIKHEHTHYKIEKTAFMTLLQKIDLLTKKYFDDFNLTAYVDRDKEMDTRVEQLMQEINTFLENKTRLQHAHLDTDDNYNKEALSCDERENELLDRLFELSL